MPMPKLQDGEENMQQAETSRENAGSDGERNSSWEAPKQLEEDKAKQVSHTHQEQANRLEEQLVLQANDKGTRQRDGSEVRG